MRSMIFERVWSEKKELNEQAEWMKQTEEINVKKQHK